MTIPKPPDFSLDLPSLQAAFPELAALEGCEQDPAWHGEGDAWTHTQMVVRALVESNDWQNLPADDRAILFYAALFHDLAKPETSRREDGRIRSPRHAVNSAHRARWMLADAGLPFGQREATVQLIRRHSAPLHLLDKNDPARAVITLSQTLRCDWLAMLARADVRGRIADDLDAKHESIDLFLEQCRLEGCINGPKAFASDHTRFRYFQGATVTPEVELYDDTETRVILMSGLPGAGKDHWIRTESPNWPVISLDAIRESEKIDSHKPQGKVVQAAREQARDYLRRKQPFIWNATNTSLELRRSLVRLFAAYKARIQIVYIDAPLERIRSQNTAREHPVPERIIDRLARRLDIPDLTEAHQVRHVARDS